jgi:hypothetical protein
MAVRTDPPLGNTPLAAVAARKRKAADKREAEAIELRRQADELDGQAKRHRQLLSEAEAGRP